MHPPLSRALFGSSESSLLVTLGDRHHLDGSVVIGGTKITVDIWERNKELIRKRTDIGEHFTREIIQSIVFIFFTTRRKSASD